nr:MULTISPECIES: divergent polysaccharide deacetylase family protein [unclassified Ectothiorhodospira]
MTGAATGATADADPWPVVAIVIDDLGNDPREARRTVALPGPLTVAVLPHTPQAHNAALWAHQRGHEVMLHLPMEADNGHDPGPGAILRHMTEYETRDTVREALASVPYVRGVNNHMGSRLSREAHHLAWVMAEVSHTDPALYFVDSRTHAQTLVRHVSTWAGLPSTQRDVFLDAKPHDADFVRKQVKRLSRLARLRGYALGIGHPYPATLEVLEAMLPELQAQGIRLVTVSDYLTRKQEVKQWHASLSPSPTAAKNSKPSH